eukprot:GHVU01216951.1.p1 GENE.GHVU01216951.1~~GHVU01216951.1.p1  ORF type:complete len:195 (-),score=10.01 GHVU01216951.1:788-1372(-)
MDPAQIHTALIGGQDGWMEGRMRGDLPRSPPPYLSLRVSIYLQHSFIHSLASTLSATTMAAGTVACWQNDSGCESPTEEIVETLTYVCRPTHRISHLTDLHITPRPWGGARRRRLFGRCCVITPPYHGRSGEMPEHPRHDAQSRYCPHYRLHRVHVNVRELKSFTQQSLPIGFYQFAHRRDADSVNVVRIAPSP